MRAGLTEAIRTDIELKMRGAGIRVIDKADNQAEDALIVVSVLTVQEPARWFAYSVGFELIQGVRLQRSPQAWVLGKTWGARNVIGTVGAARFPLVVRDVIKDMTDQFLNAYLAANPR